MSSKQTGGGRSAKTQIPEDWLPTTTKNKLDFFEPDSEKISAGTSDNDGTDESSITGDTTRPEDSLGTADSLHTTPAWYPATTRQAAQTTPRRTGSRQRKESLEEYRQTFLTVPRLEDRKPVFVSREVRDRLDEIARKLGGRRMSVSGFIENLARHHLETYHEDIEVWRKL